MKTKSALFIGPSLPSNISLSDSISVFPPIKSGDLYSILTHGYSKIGIVDGFFHGVPSIWHREIISAMDAGIIVWGSSSMGALRASELHTVGMNGCGHVFNWYANDHLNGDDEVALQHLREHPYLSLTIPLVDIRYCLIERFKLVIGQYEHEYLIQLARELSYWERTSKSLENFLITHDVDASFVQDLMSSIGNTESVKQIDARLLIENISTVDSANSPSFYFMGIGAHNPSRADFYSQLSLSSRTYDPCQQIPLRVASGDPPQAHSNLARNGGVHSLLSFWFEYSNVQNLHELAIKGALARFTILINHMDIAQILHFTKLTLIELAHFVYMSSYFYILYDSRSRHISTEYKDLARLYINNSPSVDIVCPSFPCFDCNDDELYRVESIIAIEILLVGEAFRYYELDRLHLLNLYISSVGSTGILKLPIKLQVYILICHFGVCPLGCSSESQNSHQLKYYRFLAAVQQFVK